EQNGSSECAPCKDEEYTEYPNDFSKCLGCRVCREDQVQVSPCKTTSNRQCACRNGTFCSPDHPCEMCQKCRPRCSSDEVELAPCTPQSDRQCGPPSATSDSSTDRWLLSPWPGPTRQLSLPCGLLSSQRREAMGVLGGVEDLLPNGPRERERRGSPAPIKGLGGSCRTSYFQVNVPDASCPSAKQRRNLVPVQGRDPAVLLRRSFDLFAQEVPFKDWKRFGRALELPENDITLAEMNNRYSLEPFFQMLHTWQNREGMKASVNTLLQTLHHIKLGGVAEDISSKLVQLGCFEYEVN
ncbi:TR10B factor, partial [Centropus unirufus]|nr:TR10B factor [Centropus unirufus]